MSSIPSRRLSRASSRAESALSFQSLPASTAPLALSSPVVAHRPEPSDFVVGGPPNSPSPLALRASNSPSSKRRINRHRKVPIDVRTLEYLEPCDSNLVCLICHCPFDKAVRLACDHVFCNDCVEQAFAAQEGPAPKTCPTCRSRVDLNKEPLPVPRILTSMLDELRVRCPNQKVGCTWADKRSDVQDHVELYCDHAQVECASPDCRLGVLQKDFHKGCLHYTVNCEHCHTSMMKKDLEVCFFLVNPVLKLTYLLQDHQKQICPNRMTDCSSCFTEILRHDLPSHLKDVCPKATVTCPGSVCGCSFAHERTVVVEHVTICPMATMAPFFQSQKARLDEHESQQKLLQRKVEILEGGLSSIHNMLYPANPNPNEPCPVPNPLDPNAMDYAPGPLPGTPDFRLPAPAFPSASQTDQAAAAGHPPQPPFDSSTHHLLSLHESLRDEVSRIANALTDLEGRTNMMIINENQRVKDEMLHANAAINSMRMQLHWLTSARLQAQNRSGGPGSSSAAGSSSASRASGNGSGRGGVTLNPIRRLSDSNRQDTKL
ncbi:uncharacterized protein K441DRAFT_578972 [Cenococcum geophilum 1.58]|uniref:uncharacterized protein n=1 Tax=Cenococcum geophilum 1.58 TaxID=794803 RepID=UPI00358ED748|nr:hypothetical protein K441DRAFT_578972 [Cenococcum geophilum 1.58]